MDYRELNKEQLIERIESLDRFIKEIQNEKQQEATLEYAWTGNLGHWYWNVPSNEVVVNPLKLMALGVVKDEIPLSMTYQFFTDLLHPDDYENTMNAMRAHLSGEKEVYEVEYRIQALDGSYKWFYDRGKITQRTIEGNPLFLAGIVFDITQRKRMEFELEHKNKILQEMTWLDDLTQIGNRRMLIDNLKKEMELSLMTKNPLSIAMFDIDDFKQVNDTQGHVVGDQVLIHVAQIIKNSVRKSDIVGRYGGEEFLVIFVNTPLDLARKIAEQIRMTIEGFELTVSGGVAQYTHETVADLIHLADTNLYRAKNSGKNRVV